MANHETTPTYPIEVIKQAGMDMLTPKKYLSALIKVRMLKSYQDDRAVLIRIDRVQGSIYLDDFYEKEEEAAQVADELNQIIAPMSDETPWIEEFIAVNVEGEIIGVKAQKKNAAKSK